MPPERTPWRNPPIPWVVCKAPSFNTDIAPLHGEDWFALAFPALIKGEIGIAAKVFASMT